MITDPNLAEQSIGLIGWTLQDLLGNEIITNHGNLHRRLLKKLSVVLNSLWDIRIENYSPNNANSIDFFERARTALEENLERREFELNNGPRHIVQSLKNVARLLLQHHTKYQVEEDEDLYRKGKELIERAVDMQTEYKGREDAYLIQTLMPLLGDFQAVLKNKRARKK